MSTQIGVGQRVAEMRKILGWSQPRLATESHVSVSLVRAVEQGRAPASAAFVSSCARALKVAPAELLGQPYPRTNTEQSNVAGTGANQFSRGSSSVPKRSRKSFDGAPPAGTTTNLLSPAAR